METLVKRQFFLFSLFCLKVFDLVSISYIFVVFLYSICHLIVFYLLSILFSICYLFVVFLLQFVIFLSPFCYLIVFYLFSFCYHFVILSSPFYFLFLMLSSFYLIVIFCWSSRTLTHQQLALTLCAPKMNILCLHLRLSRILWKKKLWSLLISSFSLLQIYGCWTYGQYTQCGKWRREPPV